MKEGYVDVSRISLRPIAKNIAKELIEKNHYSHKWTLCDVAFGIFFDTKQPSTFIDIDEEKLIGAVIYGGPVGRSAAESISPSIKLEEVTELTRLFIHDGYGKNIESYCISKTLSMLSTHLPKVKAVISYADNEQGHRGIIYQATGFHYQGNSSLALMPNYSISLSGPPNYKWMHSRTAFSTFGSHNVEYLKKKIGFTFWRKKESTKHRYVYLLGNKLEKKKILANLKHPFVPYPKDTQYTEEIQEIKVDNKTENLFFS